MTETWIILGATSGIARAFARLQADAGAQLILCGRDTADMAATAADCIARGAKLAQVMPLDIRDAATFQPILALASAQSGTLNAAVFVGSMPDQAAIDADPALIDGTVTDSFTGPARFLTCLAPLLEDRGSGAIAGVGSVAGDRGRLGNYVYGAAKAGFATYLSGLRNRLGRSGVHVMTVKPGPVDTAMTWGLPSMPFMTTPEAAARDIVRGLRKKRNVIYTAGIWRLVMLVIRAVPEPVFKKLRI
jgi:short-subunit dehydrogenase